MSIARLPEKLRCRKIAMSNLSRPERPGFSPVTVYVASPLQ
jgi:hypothetical protein